MVEKEQAKKAGDEISHSHKYLATAHGYNHSYDLKGIVVHYGSGLHYGHYWSLSRMPGPNSKWIEFEDTKIRVVDDREVQTYYGAPADGGNAASWNCAYMLLYQSQELIVNGEK